MIRMTTNYQGEHRQQSRAGIASGIAREGLPTSETCFIGFRYPLSQRSAVHQLAKKLGCKPATLLRRWVSEGLAREGGA